MRLFNFIQENMEFILNEWESFARDKQPPEGDMNASELRDHAEEMLRVIVADMQTAQTEKERFEKSKGNKPKMGNYTAAEIHAVSRLASGFSIDLLAAEYRAMRATVLRLWLQEPRGLQPEEVEDLIRFNEAIDQSLAESLARYSEIVRMEQNVFLGILGHDLRTPLQSISSGTEYLIHAKDMDGRVVQMGTRMHNSVKRMTGMIHNLLDFTQSRISGGIQIAPTQTNLPEVAEQVVEELRSNNPRCLIHIENKGDCTGHWDASRLAQIYQNLVSNALQYGDQDKGVLVTNEGKSSEVVIRVHNDGAPIPEQEQERLFNPLHRHAHAESEKNPRRNLGLGLYIVQEIVSAHCGTITVTSSKAEGTNFIVRLPKEPEAVCQLLKSHKSRVARASNFTFHDDYRH
jgi:signal transduction histidine kinase